MDKYFVYNDLRGHYTDQGSGPTILFVHGFAEDGTVWDHFKKSFTGYRVIVPDLPGVGKSGSTQAEFTMDMLADYLHHLLLDAAVEKVHFVGHSMGGYAGVAFAEQHPEMLISLTMFHSQPFADDAAKKESRLKQAEFVAKNGTTLFIKELYYNLFTEQFAKNNSTFIEGRIVAAVAFPASSIIRALKGMATRPDRALVLKEIKVPVLFIVGKEDRAIPHENSMKQTHQPEIADVHLLAGVNHMGMFEKEAECRKILEQFVERIQQD